MLNHKYLIGFLMALLVTVVLFTAIAAADESGSCGNNVTWYLDDNGTLTISGIGDMTSHPWTDGELSRIKKLIIKDGVTSICSSAFNGCSITEAIIPESISVIDNWSFNNCEFLTSVTIPSRVKDLGKAFVNCGRLSEVIIKNGVQTIAREAFRDCTSLTSITIPDSVYSIGVWAFAGCTNLEKITLSSGLLTLSDYIFEDCFRLKDIVIKDGLQAIGGYAFSRCTSLQSVTIPASVYSIDWYAFYGCKNLQKICCYRDSSAHIWAQERDYPYELLDAIKLYSVKLPKSEYPYTGNAIEPDVTVKAKVNGELRILEKDKDYTVTCTNNVTPGTATIQVTGIGDYKGSIKKTFTITPVKLYKVTLSKTSMAYTGKARKPVPTVQAKVNGQLVKLVKGTDYTIKYENNIEAGTATVTITGKGNYTGTIAKTFTITPAKLYKVTLSKTSMAYTGKARKPVPTVSAKVNGELVTLVKGTDYTVKYENNIDAGTATVTVTGKGNYTGTITKTFTITPVKLYKATLSKTSMAYTGKARKPVPTVAAKVNGQLVTLVKGTDYTVKYENNIKVGKATVTITGKGNYTGTITKTFTITEK